MDRKKFIRNLIGSVGAITISKYTAPLASIQSKGIIQFEAQKTYRWMDIAMYEFEKKWMEDIERVYFGNFH